MSLYGSFAKHRNLAELGERLDVGSGPVTPAVRRQEAMRNLTNDFWAISPSGVVSPGAGITAGVGTVVESTQERSGKAVKTRIFIDLTGLASSTTDLDIIGVAGAPATLAQITAAAHGAPSITGRMVCLETPAGGVDDIDLYAAAEGTGVFDGGIAALTETAIVTAGGAWAVGDSKTFTGSVAADAFLYLTGGAAGTADDYTAGKFMIEIEGSTF